MGRRDRRRQAAALGGGSRRVKLDLWNNDEPVAPASAVSGTVLELNEASEDKADAGEKQAGLSEGQAQDARDLPSGVGDPLSLLVQYSDDDEEEASEIPGGDGQVQNVDQQVLSFMAELETSGLLKDGESTEGPADGTGAEIVGQSVAAEDVEAMEELVGATGEGVEVGQVEGLEKVCGDGEERLAEHAENGKFERGTESKSFEKGEEDDGTSVSGAEQSEDKAGGDWEAVLDEASGDYFFWNVKTGETTWDRPVDMEKKKTRKRKRRDESEAKDAVVEEVALRGEEQERQADTAETERDLEPPVVEKGDPVVKERDGGDKEAVAEPESSGGSLVTLPDWEAVLDETSGEYFYWNVESGETVWDKPKGKRPGGKRSRESGSPVRELKVEQEAELSKNESEPMAVEDPQAASHSDGDLKLGVHDEFAEELDLASEGEGKVEVEKSEKYVIEVEKSGKEEENSGKEVAEVEESGKEVSDGGESDKSEKAGLAVPNEDVEEGSESGESRESEVEWERVVDKESGDHYFWNVKTGETTWEEPEGWEKQQTRAPRSETLTVEDAKRDEAMSTRSDDKLATLADQSMEPSGPTDSAKGGPEGGKDWSERNGETDHGVSEGKRRGRSGVEGSVGGGDASGMSGKWNGEDSTKREKRRKGMPRARDLRSDSTSERQRIKAVVETSQAKVEDVGPSPFAVQLVAQAEAVAEKGKHAAGSALRTLSSLVRFAIEAEIRAADCRALLAKPQSADSFWHHTETQLQRLNVVFAVECLAEEASRGQSEPPSNPAPTADQHKGAAIPLGYAPALDSPSGAELSDRPGSSDGNARKTAATALTIAELQKKPAVMSWRQRLAARRQVLTAYSDTSADTLEDGEIQSDADGPESDTPMLPPVEEEREEGEIPDSITEDTAAQTTTMDIDFTPDATATATDIDMPAAEPSPLPAEPSPLPDTTEPVLPNLPSSDVDMPGLSFPLPSPITPPSPSSADGDVPPPPPPDDVEWAPPPPLDNGMSSPAPWPEEVPMPEEPPLPESPPFPPPPEDASSPPPLPPDWGVGTTPVPLPPDDIFPSEAVVWDHAVPLNGEEGHAALSDVAAIPDVEIPLPKGVIMAAPVPVAYSGSLFPVGSYGASYGEQGPDAAVVAGPFGMGTGEDVSLVTDYGTAGTPTPSVAVAPGKKTEKDKAIKLKKRTPVPVAATTSKANKKVFSMLDKWKAAKEELQDKTSEQEEAEEDMFNGERQQQKKLKQIEEWRIQQLESGQALENANFQPLEGDWRQRVQRAKKQAAKVASKEIAVTTEAQEPAGTDQGPQADGATPAAAETEAHPETKKQRKKKPDIKGLSQGLPPGWKAFWDKESGEVYYGNLTTSETSWERPTS